MALETATYISELVEGSYLWGYARDYGNTDSCFRLIGGYYGFRKC